MATPTDLATTSPSQTRLSRLQARGRLLHAIGDWFHTQGSLPVDTTPLLAAPGLEPHIAALETTVGAGPFGGVGVKQHYYLHTSPEFAMKKLLGEGLHQIHQISQVFRDGEWGPLHQPAFALLEWYRTFAGYQQGMADCEAITQLAFCTTGQRVARYHGGEADPFAPARRLSVPEAFAQHAGIDLLASLDDNGVGNAAMLRAAARTARVIVSDQDSWDDLFFKVMLDKIEPHLGFNRPTILYDYPVPQAALARRKPGEPRLAERFELYLCGVELANGFGELCDPTEQRTRFLAEQNLKQQLYGVRYPIDEGFLAALANVPDPTVGVALGLDRLFMLALDAPDITAVMAAPLTPPC